MNCIKALWFAGVLFLTAKATAQPAVLPAKVDVSAIGTATYTIPIEVVPGTNGLQPNLAIVYNSMSGMGVLGQKWSLQGISSITRVPQSKYFDGNITSIGFDTTDRFALNGSRMLRISGNSYHANGAEYCFETEDFSKIKKIDSPNSFYFQQTLPDGNIIEYGGDDQSQYRVIQTKCLSWMTSRVVDVNGNQMKYYYTQANGEIWIDRIEYTILADNTPAFASVMFKYETLSSPNDGFIGGQRVRASKRLKEILVKYCDATVRKYLFVYSNGLQYDRLASVRLTDASDECLSSTTISWDNSPANLVVGDSSTALPSGYLMTAGNFNADRLYDIIAVNSSTRALFFQGGTPEGTNTVPNPTGHTLQHQPTAMASGDIDGDGFDELLYCSGADYQWYSVSFSNGLPSTETQLFCSNGPISLGDFDGDGIVEPISLRDSRFLFSYYIGDASFDNTVLPETFHSYCIGDFTGDGKSDLFLLDSLEAKIYTFNLHSQRWEDVESYTCQGSKPYCVSGDFNGDGLSDILYLPKNGTSWIIAVRKGADAWTFDYLPDLNIQSVSWIPLNPPVVCDINGDGKSDILQSQGDGTIKYIISKGCYDNHYQSFSTGTFTQSAGQILKPGYVTVGDFDGNGIADLFFFNPNPGSYPSSIKYFYKGTYSGYMVNKITDAAGMETKLEYSTISLMPYRYFGDGMNWMPLPLVKNLLVSDGLGGFDTTCFYYGNAQFDSGKQQFIGFSQFGKMRNKRITETFFSRVPKGTNESFAILMPDSVVNMVATSPINLDNNTYWSIASHLVPATASNRVSTTNNKNSSYFRINTSGTITFLPFVSNTTTDDFLRGTKTIGRYTLHDDNWQPHQQTTISTYISDTTTKESRRIVTYSYGTMLLQNGAEVILPTKVVTRQYNNASDDFPRRDTLSYDYASNGKPQTIRHSDNGGLSVTESLVYNSMGLPTSVSKTHLGTVTRTTALSYDPTYRFVVSTTDHAGNIIQKTFDAATGNCLTLTDINNLTTSYTYDGLGRVTQVTNPDATTKTYTYTNASGGLTSTCCYTTVAESGKPETTVYYDCLGRKTHTFVSGGGYMDIVYNKMGQLFKQTLVPNASTSLSTQLKKWKKYKYDIFGRVTKDSSYYHENTYSYNVDNNTNQYCETQEDKLGAITRKWYDAAGRISKIEDEGGVIAYSYDRIVWNGNIYDRTTMATDGNTTTILTDSRGNRVLLTDPDAGTIISTYDAWGNLLSQTDGKGDVTTLVYDNEDRVVSKTYTLDNNSEAYTYNYGNVAPIKGKIIQIIHNNTIHQSFSHDNVGRLSSTTKYIGGNAYTHLYTYNSNGQIYTIQYPSGFAVRYEYDVYGRLKHVKDHSSGTVIYTVDHRNDLGQPTRCWFGNNTGVEYTYDLWGLTTKIQYGYKELMGFRNDPGGDPPPFIFDDFSYYVGNQYSVLQYTYDDNGFITRKRDTKTSQQEDFSYDNLGRLASFTVNNTLTHDFVYEDNGNIGTNSLVGSYDYAYDSDKPHAVTGIVSEAGNIPSTQCDVTYNSRNRPATISEDGWSLELSYGSGLQREKSVLKQGNSVKRTTYHISKDCELDILPACSCSRYMDYIFADGKIVAIHVHNTAANADSMYYVQTDLLGSWDRIVDDGRSVVQSSHFDPWGNRKSASNWTVAQDGSGLGFRRGFTGHEHYDRFGIINMNARLYDPVIGRFFSPDPQMQNPYSTQGLNRYSYCGNNPVMNIDPDGEFLISMVLFAGITNYVIHNNQGDISNAGDGWGYFGQGALAGLIKGLNWVNTLSLISLGSPTGMAIVNAKTLSILSTGLSMIKDFSNASSIFFGKYYFDGNMAHGYSQALTRFTTESLQTWVGYNYTQFRNLFGGVDRVDYLGGATFATNESTSSHKGVTLGSYVNIWIEDKIVGTFQDRVLSDPIYMHEYGHALDSQVWGIGYLPVIGVPSGLSAWINSYEEHHQFWTEKRANKRAKKYFEDYYGVDWDGPAGIHFPDYNSIEELYPTD